MLPLQIEAAPLQSLGGKVFKLESTEKADAAGFSGKIPTDYDKIKFGTFDQNKKHIPVILRMNGADVARLLLSESEVSDFVKKRKSTGRSARYKEEVQMTIEDEGRTARLVSVWIERIAGANTLQFHLTTISRVFRCSSEVRNLKQPTD